MNRRKNPTSLASKLLTLNVGETIYLDDPRETGRSLDAAIQALMSKKQVGDARFIATRMVAVAQKPASARPILAITRTGLEEPN